MVGAHGRQRRLVTLAGCCVALLGGVLALPGCAPPPPGTKRPAEPAPPFTVRQVELPYRTCDKPQKVGSSIYTVVRHDEETRSELIRYDLDTRSAESVVDTHDGQMIGWFVVNDRWLVWSVDERLFARPLAGGETRVLSKERGLYGPALSGDMVALDDLSPSREHQIVLHDLARRESTVVAPVALADLYNNFPHWDGDRLLWTDVVGGEGLYRLYDPSSRRITDHRLAEGSYRFPGYAQAAGSRLFSINFDDVEEWNWGKQRLGYYSTAAKRFVPLVPEGFVANSLEVAGGLVAVIDSNQRLTLRLAAAPLKAPYRPIEGTVDFVQGSSDGTLIAWQEGVGAATASTLYLIERR